ncbi:MAG: hypothetical protein JO256_14370 [Alphaproteobacteria bacterium]|nr:hypothetical protein [Alphaproteobacteria bacterium]
MKHALVLAVTALLLGGCATMESVKQTVGLSAPPPVRVVQVRPPPPPPDPKTQMAELETRLSVLVDQTRRKLDTKARPLQLDAELVKIARARAADMAEKNYLAHAAPNGDTSASLLMAADAQYQGLLGENLAAQHYRPESGVDPAVFAERFLATWMDSPAHRDNLTFADYDRTGVGAAVNGDTVYVALLFSTTTKANGSGQVAAFGSPQEAQAPAPLRGTAQ